MYVEHYKNKLVSEAHKLTWWKSAAQQNNHLRKHVKYPPQADNRLSAY